jgi:hypothetical protein
MSLAAASASAQDGRLNLDRLTTLESKASQVVEVNVESPLLQLAPKFLPGGQSADEKILKELVASLKGVYVRHYEFEKPGEYSPSDVDSIRSQLGGWSKVLGIRSKRQSEVVEVLTLGAGTKLSGLVILATGPKDITVVNVIGEIDLEKLIEMARRFGLLDIELDKSIKE